jgi:hypothetical protein
MISIQHPESRDKRGVLILRVPQPSAVSSCSGAEVLAEAEATEWEAALVTVAKKTIGTCKFTLSRYYLVLVVEFCFVLRSQPSVTMLS